MNNIYDNQDTGTLHSSSRLWYLLPIFLSIVGGLISYRFLRKKDPSRARKTLVLGTALFTFFVLLLAIGATASENKNTASSLDSEPSKPDMPPEITNQLQETNHRQLSIQEIKSLAIEVPYDLLVEHNDVYVGDIIHYVGYVSGVREGIDDESYVLKIEVYGPDDSMFVNERMVWSNYRPETDRERELVRILDENSGLFTIGDSTNAVNVWGVLQGLRDFDIVIDKYVIPESDVLLLEMLASDHTQDNDDGMISIYTVSYDGIPDYVDAKLIKESMNDAIQSWEINNPLIDFIIVENDADLAINWARNMYSNNLGLYTAKNITTNGELIIKHNILIRLGDYDCNSRYQQYSNAALKHTIAHELGHYLGLRHIDEQDSLMYASGFFGDADNIFTYNDRQYNIPKIDRAENRFMATDVILSDIKIANQKLDALAEERSNIKNNNPDQSLLASNKNKINVLTQQITDLNKQAACIGE